MKALIGMFNKMSNQRGYIDGDLTAGALDLCAQNEALEPHCVKVVVA